MNHKLIIAAACAALLPALPAAAQDNWNGFYIGGNIGGAWGDTSLQTRVDPGTAPIVIPPEEVALINLPDADDDNDAGFTGGIHGGYNWHSGSLVLGVETDFGWFDIEQSRARTFTSPLLISPPIEGTLEQEMSTDWLWTVRPRVGWASGPWMVYGTAGIAVAKVQLDVNYQDTRTPPIAATLASDDTKTGWTAGLGAAYQFQPQLEVRGEWLYVDLGTVRASAVTPGGAAIFTSEAEAHGNLLRVGVDYRF